MVWLFDAGRAHIKTLGSAGCLRRQAILRHRVHIAGGDGSLLGAPCAPSINSMHSYSVRMVHPAMDR